MDDSMGGSVKVKSRGIRVWEIGSEVMKQFLSEMLQVLMKMVEGMEKRGWRKMICYKWIGKDLGVDWI